MQQVPVITVFVRHGVHCPHTGDEFYKRCGSVGSISAGVTAAGSTGRRRNNRPGPEPNV
jgi:hypothetical protein